MRKRSRPQTGIQCDYLPLFRGPASRGAGPPSKRAETTSSRENNFFLFACTLFLSFARGCKRLAFYDHGENTPRWFALDGSKVEYNPQPTDVKVEHNIHRSDGTSWNTGIVDRYLCRNGNDRDSGTTGYDGKFPKLNTIPSLANLKVEFNTDHSEPTRWCLGSLAMYPSGG